MLEDVAQWYGTAYGGEKDTVTLKNRADCQKG